MAARQALLLAAGVGSRLRPLTDVLPKCLVPICGRPLIAFWLDILARSGIDRVVINTHYRAELVQRFLAGYRFPGQLDVTYEIELLGTGGTLLANRSKFRSAEPILVAHADNLTVYDGPAFATAHDNRPARTEMTMMTFTTPEPQTCGIVQLDYQGVVQEFHEKKPNPPGDLANGAVYILEPSVLDFIATRDKKVIDLSTEVLPAFLGRIYTYHNSVYHRDIGNLASYLMAQIDFPMKSKIRDGDSALNGLIETYGSSLLDDLQAAVKRAFT